MEQTIRLYDEDAYQTKFSATVLICEEVTIKEEKKYQVILDRTLFFPEGGGQSADQGTIQDVKVLDVQIKNNIITHTLEQNVMAGSIVEGQIDWKHRFYNMQQHSGEHLFSGLVHSQFGYDNIGFHLSNQVVTMDFNGMLSATDIKKIEQEVNECIVKNLSIEVTFPSKGELKGMEYRSKIDIEGQVRIVTVPGYDICACCAPHVKRTGEIGMLKVVNAQKYKGGIRISILCGFRALADYREKLENVLFISKMLSTKPELVAEATHKLKNDLETIRQELTAVKQELMMKKIIQIPEQEVNVCIFEKEAEAGVMRTAVNVLVKEHKGYCGIFAGTDETGYRYIIGIGDGDAREMGKQLKKELSAKGGGSMEMIQGFLQGTEKKIRELFFYSKSI
jgi:alanyl-tRNA synthetase